MNPILKQILFRKIPGKNLFNKSTVTLDSIIYLEGNTFSAPGACESDYISINSNITFRHNIAASYVTYWDISKIFITGGYSENTAELTPANTAYVRLSMTQLELNTAQIEFGIFATAYEPYRG